MNYQWHYDVLIERAKKRSLSEYTEKHHIIPRCMGGKDDSENIVILTGREHFIAHQLLVKIYPGNGKLIYACKMMSMSSKYHTGRISNRVYGWIREKVSKQNRINSIGTKHPPRSDQWRMKRKEALKGKPLSSEHKKKISEGLTGLKRNEDFKIKMSTVASNRSKEHKDNLSASLTGRKISEETKQRMKDAAKITKPVICPYCGKEGNPRAMYRWHFDNCKVK